MKKLFEIFKIYFLIGIQLIGGGYVILPLLKKYLVEDRNWMKEEELVDYLALSQCLPGIIALNISVFSGYHLSKLKGAIAAISGLILPSFLIILLLAGFIFKISNNPFVSDIFYGVRLSIIVLIFYMVKDIFNCSIKSKFSIFLFLFVLLSIVFLKLSPTVLILTSIILSLIWGSLKKGKNA